MKSPEAHVHHPTTPPPTTHPTPHTPTNPPVPRIIVGQHSKLLDGALVRVDEVNHLLVFLTLVHFLWLGLGLVDHLTQGGRGMSGVCGMSGGSSMSGGLW